MAGQVYKKIFFNYGGRTVVATVPTGGARSQGPELEENFVITVRGDVEKETFSQMDSIIEAHEAVSTGNLLGCNVQEYFFSVKPSSLDALQQALGSQIRDSRITFSTLPRN